MALASQISASLDNYSTNNHSTDDYGAFFQAHDLVGLPPLSVQTEVHHLEDLLSRVFGDEIDRTIETALSFDNSFSWLSSFDSAKESIIDLDCRPSIISADDEDERLRDVVEWQRSELKTLRDRLAQKDQEIKALKVELAAKSAELSYMPALLDKALLASNLQEQIDEMSARPSFWARLMSYIRGLFQS